LIGNELVFKTYIDDIGNHYCMNWSLVIKYEFKSMASIVAIFDSEGQLCE